MDIDHVKQNRYQTSYSPMHVELDDIDERGKPIKVAKHSYSMMVVDLLTGQKANAGNVPISVPQEQTREKLINKLKQKAGDTDGT